MNFFTKIWTVLGPRIIAAAAGGAATKLAERGVTVDPATLVSIGLGTYGIVHKIISSKVNPGDAASSRMAAAEKTASDFGTTVVVPPPTK
jgi:hypothetical protein